MSMSQERLLTLALATAGFGVSTVMRKLAVDQLHPLQYQFVSATLYTLLIPIIWNLNVSYGETAKWSLTGIIWTVSATLIHIIAAFFFNVVLRSGNDTGIVSALAGASPIVTLMLSFAILKEQPSIYGMLGMGFVLIGIVLMTY